MTPDPIPSHAKSADEIRFALSDAELAIAREFKIPAADWRPLVNVPSERVRWEHSVVDALTGAGFSERLAILCSSLALVTPSALSGAPVRREVALKLARAIAGSGVRWVEG